MNDISIVSPMSQGAAYVAAPLSSAQIGALALQHLRGVIAIDSASDERSESIPSTPGQITLARHVASFMEGYGATVEMDDFANVIATLPGRGLGATQAPIAFMVHLDTARGTDATDDLTLVPAWQGAELSYSKNPGLSVSVANYPLLSGFVGHDVVHGPGDAPIGLDDKLGLTHLMTLASLLHRTETIDHPPILLIGRPDEEIGRMAAIEGLALTLAERGVAFGYTVDGILGYEVNVENFNAAAAKLTFTPAPGATCTALPLGLNLVIGGVNTHGCTAKAEGHRPATRLAAELLSLCAAEGLTVEVRHFISDSLRDCDGVLDLAIADQATLERVTALAQSVVGPHFPRGASLVTKAGDPTHNNGPLAQATAAGLAFIGQFLNSDAITPIAAEASDGRQGYSQPYRLIPAGDQVIVDVRIRDFDTAGLAARVAHVSQMATDFPAEILIENTDQYVNMAPRLADRPELVTWPIVAAAELGQTAQKLPIRGGTGVDPFLDAGVPVANLGTGYFAPESEKELTSVQEMAGHAQWLFRLVQTVAHARTSAIC
ncbi:MAG: hypothetical protein KC502_14375 [Myxococcales bacterium]|nr:hypothetical protein [Myxococcales bacterium]